MTDWSARQAEAATADGEDWETLHEAFARDWKAAYSRRFIEFAVSRGWSEFDAATWPDNIVDDALLWGACEHDWCPIRTAEADVMACEVEDA